MPDRTEPRFKTDTPAAIQVIRDKSRTIDCRITDISGVGFQMSLPEPLQQGEFIRMLVDGKCVICVVRRCVGDDSGFTIGLERVDQWAAGGQWNDQAPAANPASVKNPVGDLRSAAMHNLFGYRLVLGRRVSPRTFSLILSGCAIMAILSVGVAVMPHRAASSNPVAKAAQPAAPNGEATQAKDQVATASTDSNKSRPADSQPSDSKTSNSKPTASTAQPTTATAAVNSAKEIPSVASPTTAPPVAKPATTNPAPLVASAKPVATQAAVAPASQTAPVAAVANGQNLSIVASDMSWVAACADGKKIFEKVFEPGMREELHFSNEAVIRSGNAGALAINLGSQHLNNMGEKGSKRWLKATPASLEVLASPVAGPCAGR